MKKRRYISILIICCFALVSTMVQITAAGEHDALIQSAKKEYEDLKISLVKKYEDGYKKAPEQDHEYRRLHGKDTIRNQVKNWEWTATDGYNKIVSFIGSEDFDKAAIINDDYHFNQALSMPVRYKDTWPDEIGPAWNAAQSCCATDDINECRCLILKKAFPFFRDFSNKIERQVEGFFRSLDQSKLTYYDDYRKKTQRFSYTWPKNIQRRINFFEGENYDQEFQSWKVSGCGFGQPSLLTLDIRSNEGRSQGIYVNLYFNEVNNSRVWFEGVMENAEILESGGNYLIVKHGDSNYCLIHFFKGRKSQGVVYTMETDKTVDAMVRYMIFALKDYVLSGGGSPAPGPEEAPSADRVMDVEPITSTNLNTSPNKGNTCTFEVTVTGKEGAPVSGAEVVFEKPKLGTLSLLKVKTGASGKAQIIYTAPTDEEVAATGKQQVDVYVNAKDTASGAKGSELLHVRSTTSDMTASTKHKILPAHSDYYNEIVFKFNAADKLDGSPYKARITAKGQYAALVRELYQPGGAGSLDMDVVNNRDCTLYYHWSGPPTMKQALDETVTIEIPELKLKHEVAFSVGIDLQIVSVQRAYGGDLFPIMWEPFHVTVIDGFHPNEDLVKLLKEFSIKTDLKIEQVNFTAAPVNPSETGFLSALITRIEGISGSSLQEAVIWDAGQWEVSKTRDMKYVLMQKGTYEDGKPWMEYPAIVFWERGAYQFKASMNPGPFDSDPRNNSVLTELYEVREFRGFSDEVIHTVFMPSAEFLASALSGFSKSLPLKMAFCSKGLAGDLNGGKY
ncbi:MAG: Ig-like domain-containing protein, partial [Desulfobacterales bacterium]|nr:Ig-like domain-containing protein [Desulfobacterales bacterium]